MRNYYLLIFIILCGIIFILEMTGCSALEVQSQLPSNSVYYLNDMTLTVNGVTCQGVCVARSAGSYTIKIESKNDIDQLIITTCKRPVIVPSAIKTGWFKANRGYTYNYVPGLIENDPGCDMNIAGYNKDKGQTASGIIIFENPKYSMPFGVSCADIKDYGASGSAICQEMKGQRMLIWFPRPVKNFRQTKQEISNPSKSLNDIRCNIPMSADGIRWEFPIADRECNYEFETVEAPYLKARLMTIGAEAAQIRGQ